MQPKKNETVVDQNVAPRHFLQHKIYLYVNENRSYVPQNSCENRKASLIFLITGLCCL